MIDMIKDLIKKYPNDADLGRAVRDLQQECDNCGKEYYGTEKISVCPSCYV